MELAALVGPKEACSLRQLALFWAVPLAGAEGFLEGMEQPCNDRAEEEKEAEEGQIAPQRGGKGWMTEAGCRFIESSPVPAVDATAACFG